MEDRFSPQWQEFMRCKRLYHEAAQAFHQELPLEQQVRDVRRALEDREQQLVITGMMADYQISQDVVEQVADVLVQLLFSGSQSVVGWCLQAMRQLSPERKARSRERIATLLLEQAARNTGDDFALLQGLALLRDLGCYDQARAYIQRFGQYMELDDEDRRYYTGEE